jgi:hypothetical protein
MKIINATKNNLRSRTTFTGQVFAALELIYLLQPWWTILTLVHFVETHETGVGTV